jgi:hypothetical protein
MATNEVIRHKHVSRDQAGYIVGVELSTTKRRTFVFSGRDAALWANSHLQRLQSITPAEITVKHTIES